MAADVSVDQRDASTIDLSVVIVSFHCRDQVLACAESVARSHPSRQVEVIVVDNGSTDGTLQALADLDPQVRLIPMGTNAGFSRANNVGIREARGRHILVLNPDTIVEVGALDRLADWLDDHPQAAVVAPQLCNPDGTDQRTARSFPTPAAAIFGRRSPLTRWFPRNRYSRRFLSGRDHAGDQPFRVDWVSGAAMMVPVSAIARVGAFDEAFFLFWEDADWCRRFADAGLEVWCIPGARVTHDEGGTRGHGWAPRVVAHFHRGAYLYWRKHHTPQAWNPIRWGVAVALGGRAIAVMTTQQMRAVLRSGSRPPTTATRSSVPIPQPSR